MIKPGSVCYLVDMGKFNGRVVTVIARSPYMAGYWIVDAVWVRPLLPELWRREASVLPENLRPIDDPDEPVTTYTPEALTA